MVISTPRLKLQLESPHKVRERISSLPPEMACELSPDWLARIKAATEPDPWLHGFSISLLSHPDSEIGSIGFKGPPDSEGVPEVAYAIEEAHQGQGYATEALQGIVEFLTKQSEVSGVRAHTLPSKNASTAVLAKCDFRFVGEVTDPEDGQVWGWERMITTD